MSMPVDISREAPQAFLRGCLRETRKVLGFNTFGEVAQRILETDPTIRKGSVVNYLQNHPIGTDSEKIAVAAAKIMANHFDEVVLYYEKLNLSDELSYLAGIIQGYTGLYISARSSATKIDLNTVREREFHSKAQNYDRVDFVSGAEVTIDNVRNEADRGVYAQVNFVERLYVENAKARIEFGVRRAFLTIDCPESEKIEKDRDIEARDLPNKVRFITLHDAPESITVCIDANETETLGELSLIPTAQENFFCRLGSIKNTLDAQKMKAELRISLDTEAIFFTDEVEMRLGSTKKKKYIEAIMAVAATKGYQKIENGMIRRPIEISERQRR